MSDTLQLALLVLLCGVTPGPSTLLAAGIGAIHGFSSTVPHILGTAIGYSSLAVVFVSGSELLEQIIPGFEMIARIAGSALLLWLAWRIAWSSTGPLPKVSPLSFTSSFGLQWLNPKAWATVAAAATLSPELAPGLEVALSAIAFALLLPPGVACWAIGGHAIRLWLNTSGRCRVFHGAVSVLLVGMVGLNFAKI